MLALSLVSAAAGAVEPLFQPLLADPRWPRLGGSMVRYEKGEGLGKVFQGDFGGNVELFGGETAGGRPWRAGVVGGVFTQFDMATLSNDQISGDYLIGFPFIMRSGRWTWMGRFYHISTHLGDEYVLTHPGFTRVNVSYESLDAKASFAASPSWRLYAGVGRMIRRDPPDLKPGSLQQGLEWRHARALWGGRLRPVAGVDLQQHQRAKWANGLSIRAGVEVEKGLIDPSRRLMLLLLFYRGKDPTGQFYLNTVQSAGFGVHGFF